MDYAILHDLATKAADDISKTMERNMQLLLAAGATVDDIEQYALAVGSAGPAMAIGWLMAARDHWGPALSTARLSSAIHDSIVRCAARVQQERQKR